MLHFLYETIPGRTVLKVLTQPWFSELSGTLLDAPVSRLLIPGFIRKNDIDMREYEPVKYHDFNEFFCRKVREGKRPVDENESDLIAPCDGLLSAYHIEKGLVIPVKGSSYSIHDLVRSQQLASRYKGGTCLVFRLCVNHYHRYAYIDSGRKSENYHIEGILHTVRPIALRNTPVFKENTREYTLIKTPKLGTIVQMEVGAMLVGRICNHQEEATVTRGQEKGFFQYGGSTIIVLLQKDKVKIPEKFFQATCAGEEIPVKLGQKIGTSTCI